MAFTLSAEYLNNYGPISYSQPPVEIDIHEGLGQVIMPSGEIVGTEKARVVINNKTGKIRSAFPILPENQSACRPGGSFVLNITLELRDEENITSLDWDINLENQDQDYDYDCILLDICNMLYEAKQVIFKIEGFGEKWNIVDCKADLPCILEQMDTILEVILKKGDFEIDFYEQGLERLLKFSFKRETVCITCTSYVNMPPISVIEMEYESVKHLFWKLYDDFLMCIERLLPRVMKNTLFNEWRDLCNSKLK